MSLFDLYRRLFHRTTTAMRSWTLTRLSVTMLEDRTVPAAIRGTVSYVDGGAAAGVEVWVLRGEQADRSRFVDPAIEGLASPEVDIRRAAVHLLAEIGAARDTAPIVAILSDKEWTNSIAAARRLRRLATSEP